MIAIASDHGGFALKAEIVDHLRSKGEEFTDFGAHTAESCDYPVYGEAAGRAVAEGKCDKGIIICGTGIGISIAANKIPGIRAALCGDCYSAEMARRHNDANILALGARVIGTGHALKIVDVFSETPFDGGRHAKRVDLIRDIENKRFTSREG